LIRAEDEASLWNERFESERSGVFAVQDEIAGSIAEALKIELTSAEASALARKGTDNIEAYNAYLQGRFFWRKRGEKDLYRALEKFERAIELDPDYAEAYSGIADVWSVIDYNSNVSMVEALPKAREAAQKALSLNDRLAEAHASMGLVLRHELAIEASEEYYRRALDLNPNYAWAHVWYANIFTDIRSDYEQGIKHLETSLQLDPLSTVALNNLSFVLKLRGDIDSTGVLLRRSLEIEPDLLGTLVHYSNFFSYKGQSDSALYYAERALNLYPDKWRSRIRYGWLQGIELGNRKEGKRHFEGAIELNPRNDAPYDSFGRFYNTIGDVENAIVHFNKAVEANPRSHGSYNSVAYCYAAIGKYKEAIASINKAIEINPYFQYYIDSRADINAMFGYYDQAVADYQLYLRENPNSKYTSDVIMDLIKASIGGKNFELADSISTALLGKADGASPAELIDFARILRYQGRFRSSISMLNKWLSVEATGSGDNWQSSFTLYDIAMLYMNYLDEIDNAITCFERSRDMVMRLDSTSQWSVILHGRIAQALAKSGRESEARQVMNSGLELMDTTGDYNTYLFHKSLMEYNLGNYDSALAIISNLSRKNFTINVASGYIHLAAGLNDTAVTILEQAILKDVDNQKEYPERSVHGHYFLARAYEAAGRSNDAVEQYETFLTIWKNADKGLPLVEDAEKRLAELKRTI
jgi:tetratricopeptide (TPR) repeat protein